MDADGVGWVPCVAVNDVGVAADAALVAGGTIVERGAWPDDTPFSLVRDPDGAVFGMCPPTGRHVMTLAQEAGTIWWVEALTKTREGPERFYGFVFGWQFSEQALEPHPHYMIGSVGEERVGGFLPIGPDWNVAPRWQVLVEVENLEGAPPWCMRPAAASKWARWRCHGPAGSPASAIRTMRCWS